MSKESIIFFDGVCGLCHGFIQFVMKQDHGKKYHFSPLQGERASVILDVSKREVLDSLVVWENDQPYEKSDAVFRVLQSLSLFWKVLALFRFLPRGIRDFFYDRIASVRYRFFGKYDECPIPSPEERGRFLP